MISAVIGRRWSGKSTLAYWLALYLWEARWLFDPTRRFPRRPLSQSFAHSVAGTRTATATLGGEDEASHAPIDEVLIVPLAGMIDPVFDAQSAAIVAWLNEYRALQSGKVGWLIDEAYMPIDPRRPKMPAYFDQLVRLSDRSRFDLILTAHAATDIHPIARRLVDYWYFFQIVDENDLKVVRERTTADVAEQLPGLQQFEYVLWNEKERKADTRKNAARWFIELNAMQGGLTKPEESATVASHHE